MDEKKLTDEKAFTLSGVTEWLSTKAKTDEDMYYVGAIAGTYLAYERLHSENKRLDLEVLEDRKYYCELLGLRDKEIKEQKAEIERLKGEKNDWKQRYDSESNRYADLCNASSECVQKKNDRIAELQKQVERLTSLYDGKSGFMTSSIGDLPLTVEGLRTAVDEISRLLIVQAELQELNAKYYNEAKDLRRANAELQKQVDELKKSQVIECHGMLKGCDMIQQAVKDTAKEIYDFAKRFFEWDEEGFVSSLKSALYGHYGVEVE